MTESTEPAAASANEECAITRSTWLVSSVTMISRVLGLVRDKCLVLLFGPTAWVLDAFILAFTIPNLFRRLFGEGALTASFIPVFVQTREQESAEASGQLASSTLTLLIAVTGCIAAAGMLLCMGIDLIPQLHSAATEDSAAALAASGGLSLSLKLTAMMLPFLSLICVSALLAGMLQSLRSFAVPALMSVVLNIAFLATFYMIYTRCGNAPPQTTIFYVAGAVVIAGVVQVLLQLPLVMAKGVRLFPRWDLGSEPIKEVLKAMGPTALGLGVVQFNVLIDNLVAYYLSLTGAEGATTYLYLGNRLMQLPLGVFGIAVATTVFPYLASDAGKNDFAGMSKRLHRSIRLLAFILLPASAGLIVTASPIVRMIYQEPDMAFSHAAVYRTAAVLVCYAAGLFCFGLQHLLTRCFYARRDYTTPIKIAVGMVGINLVLNFILIHAPDLYRQWGFSHALQHGISRETPLREAGLALATSLTALLNVCLLWHVLADQLKLKLAQKTWDKIMYGLGWSIMRIVLAATAMGVFTYWIVNSMPAEPELLIRLERGLLPVALGALGYAIICAVIPVPEFEEFLSRKKKPKKVDSHKGNANDNANKPGASA